ncbi:MAG: ABC transporter ATP-binding protein, partial [Yoonia sp.]|uniref:ABC transporter ATP-binding protein n=1 Tax=Yoonia sp. TaxID=2212373 RepID=UPI003EF5E304
PPLLRMEGVRKTYRAGGLFSGKKIEAVRGVDIQMPAKPSILAIVGESGSGKSTLAKMILRQERQTAGGIYLGNEVIHAPKESPISDKDLRTRIQSIAQSPFDAFSIHLTVDYYLRRTAVNLLGLKDETAIEAAMEKALNEVGLTVAMIAGKFLHQFSGGELQRISIARALIPDPVLIVADEPVSMVDASIRMNIINLFRDVMQKKNVSFLYITHDLATAFYLADELIIMQSGEIVEQGKPATVLEAPSHEYTKLLINSIPMIGAKWEELSH